MLNIPPGDPQLHRKPSGHPPWLETLKIRAWQFTSSRRLKIAARAAGISLAILFVTGAIIYFQCARRIDRQLASGVFADSVNIYASPLYLSVGDRLRPEDLAAELDIAGYKASPEPTPLSYRMSREAD